MKHFLFIFAIITPYLVFSQLIDHFETIDARWNVAKTFPAGNTENPSFVATTTTIMGIAGDSLIDGIIWKKIKQTTDPNFIENLELLGLIRNDNQLIIARNLNNQIDTIYNFNLTLGDSIKYRINSTTHWLKVTSIDNLVINGNSHRRFFFSEPQGLNAFDRLNEYWIEGIGSIHGPLFPTEARKFSEETPDSLMLTCTFANQQIQWNHPNYNTCYINHVLAVNSAFKSLINIYPNPFNEQLVIKNEGIHFYRMKLFTQQGTLIKDVSLMHDNQTINLSELPCGFYLVTFYNDQISTTLTIVKV